MIASVKRTGGNVNLTACVNAVRVRVQVQVSDHNGHEHVVRVYRVRGECKFGWWYCWRGKVALPLVIEVKAKTWTGSSNACACSC